MPGDSVDPGVTPAYEEFFREHRDRVVVLRGYSGEHEIPLEHFYRMFAERFADEYE